MADPFRASVRAWIDKAKASPEKVGRAVLLEIGDRLVDRSPVGDPSLWSHPAPANYEPGLFRGNWQYGNSSTGEPSEPIDRKDPSGESTKATFRSEIPEKVTGMVHYFVNAVPYAWRIELGWSSQAPAGVVGLTVVEVPDIVNRAVQEEGQ